MSQAPRKKVVHLSSVHKASDTRIFVKECRSLAAAGYDVTLIARADRDETIDGVKILAVKSGGGNRFRRMTATVFDLFRKAVAVDADIYHFHDPELIPVGLLLKLRGKRIIYDVHENVAKQIQSKFWIPALMRKPVAIAFRLIECLAASVFDGIVAATPGIADGFPASKTAIVQNFAIIEEFASIDTSDYESRPPAVAYLGGITRARGIEEMVDAIDLLDSDVRLLLGGAYAPPELEAEMKKRPGYQKVEFRGWLDRNGVRDALASARAGLLVLHPEPNYIDSYPVKLFEYFAAGLPVIVSDFPFWDQFIKEWEAGLMVEPTDETAIAKAFQWIIDNPGDAKRMGQRGRNMVELRYSWEAEVPRLLELYSDLV